MKKIDYLEILKKAWKVTWKNKFLWWFGFFLALGSLGSNFNFSNKSGWSEKINNGEFFLSDFFSQNEELIFLAVVLFFLAVLAIGIMKIFSQAGILKALSKIEKQEETDFKVNFKEGRKYFWKIVGAGLVLGMAILFVLIIFSIPIVMLFQLDSSIFAFICIFLALTIFIPLVVVVSYIGKYAIFYIVLSDLKIKESFENGYKVFRSNVFPSIVMSLIFIPISMLLMLCLLIFVLAAAVLFFPIGLIFYLAGISSGVLAVVSSGVICLILCLIFVNAVYQTFYQSVWFLFFREIALVREDKILVAEEEIKEEISKDVLPSPKEAL
jgi:hypothetical protein